MPPELETTPPPKRGPGRPKGSKNKPKKKAKRTPTRAPQARPAPAEPEAVGVDPTPPPESVPEAPLDAQDIAPDTGAPDTDSGYSDPFAEDVLPPPSQRGGNSIPGAAENTESIDLVGGEPPPDKVPLGKEKAEALFNQFCVFYNAMGAEKFTLVFSRKSLSMMPSDDAKRVFQELTEIALLSDGDQELIREPVVNRLAELQVSKNADLWVALGMVFGLKAYAISTGAKTAAQGLK